MKFQKPRIKKKILKAQRKQIPYQRSMHHVDFRVQMKIYNTHSKNTVKQ